MVHRTPKLRGLYGIASVEPANQQNLVAQVEEAIRGGVKAVQYRAKGITAVAGLAQASELLRLCRSAGIPLIVNDNLDLASRIGADGIHLGKDDVDPALARLRLGPEAIIGISCYNSFERAVTAQQMGADYVAFGSFYPSNTKPKAVRAKVDLLERAAQDLSTPIVAIGGITPENGGALLQAGADMLAVIDGLFAQPDIKDACSRFTQLFASTEDFTR